MGAKGKRGKTEWMTGFVGQVDRTIDERMYYEDHIWMAYASNNNSPDTGLFTITNRFYKSSYCLKLSIHGNHHRILSTP